MKTKVAIFMDLQAHIEAGRFIRANSSNRHDIRDFTFGKADLSQCKDILDLGCSYGFFTRGMSGRLHPEAQVIGIDLWEGCRKYYINACQESRFSGHFYLSEKFFRDRFQGNFFDLVLCAYTLYFFPDAIPEIVRVLKPNGKFITVTHAIPHMPELIHIIKKILLEHRGYSAKILPMEKLFQAFSSANGYKKLSPFFRKVNEYSYVNSLEIDSTSLSGLIDYLCFKKPMFFPEELHIDDGFIKEVVADYIKMLLSSDKSLKIIKNDTVYVCQNPLDSE